MQTQTTPSAHVCTPPQGHIARWISLSFAEQELQALDQLVAMMGRTHPDTAERLALMHAAAVLSVRINDRQHDKGGAA